MMVCQAYQQSGMCWCILGDVQALQLSGMHASSLLLYFGSASGPASALWLYLPADLEAPQKPLHKTILLLGQLHPLHEHQGFLQTRISDNLLKCPMILQL
jgi:hypothetical protein